MHSFRCVFAPPIRRYSTVPAPAVSRFARLEARLPRFIRHLTTPLRTAPASHITAFLLLHEVTAVVPVIGFTALFYYTQWLPPFSAEKYVAKYTQQFGDYLRRKGYFKEGKKPGRLATWWNRGEGGVRFFTAFTTAYAITKVLFPLRLVVSVWCTPWFGRWTVIPVTAAMQRLYGRWSARKVSATSVAGVALPKELGGR